jgi:hypothetical protein
MGGSSGTLGTAPVALQIGLPLENSANCDLAPGKTLKSNPERSASKADINGVFCTIPNKKRGWWSLS